MKQHELLAPSPRCQIIPFPSRNLIGKARHVASKLDGRDDRAARAYWTRICNGLAHDLEAAGIGSDAIGRELESFRDAVQRELSERRGAA